MPAAAPGSLRLGCATNTPVPLGSEAAAAGLCAGQCILKVNGNNVLNDSALEVLEHFQAFRGRGEEALVRHPAAKGIREALLSGVGGCGPPAFCGERPEGTTAFWVGEGAACLAGLTWVWALCPLCLPEPGGLGPDNSGSRFPPMGVIRPSLLTA